MRTSLLIIFLSICSLSFGQIADNTSRKNDRNIYYQVLVRLYKVQHYDKNLGLDSVFLIQNPPITDSLLSLFSDRVIFIILTKEDAKRRMEADENFTCMQLSP